MFLALVPLHQDEVTRRESSQQLKECGFGAPVEFVHLHPTLRRGNDYFARARLSVLIRVLTGLINIESMVGVLECRDSKAAPDEQRNQLGDERGLARPTPTDNTQDSRAAHL